MIVPGAVSGSFVARSGCAEGSDFECKFVTIFRGVGWAVVTLWPPAGSRVQVVVVC